MVDDSPSRVLYTCTRGDMLQQLVLADELGVITDMILYDGRSEARREFRKGMGVGLTVCPVWEPMPRAMLELVIDNMSEG